MFGCCRRGNFYIRSHTNTFLTFFHFFCQTHKKLQNRKAYLKFKEKREMKKKFTQLLRMILKVQHLNLFMGKVLIVDTMKYFTERTMKMMKWISKSREQSVCLHTIIHNMWKQMYVAVNIFLFYPSAFLLFFTGFYLWQFPSSAGSL